MRTRSPSAWARARLRGTEGCLCWGAAHQRSGYQEACWNTVGVRSAIRGSDGIMIQGDSSRHVRPPLMTLGGRRLCVEVILAERTVEGKGSWSAAWMRSTKESRISVTRY